MSNCCCIVGLILSILLSRIQVGQCCISVQFMNENNVLKLSCVIPSFSGTGSWYVDSLSLTSCSPTVGCTIQSSGNYTFSSDSLGIYVNIDPFSSLEVGKLWECDNAPSFECNVTVSEPQDSPTSEISTYLATETTTSLNSIFEFSNITIAVTTGSIVPTSEISASTKSFLNNGTTNTNAHTVATNVYSNTETTHLYSQTETPTSYLNTENTNSNADTETYIQTNTLRIVTISMSTHQRMFLTKVENDISESFDTTNQIMTDTFTLPGYSISSYNEILLSATFETSNLFLDTLSETSMFLSEDTLSNNLFNTLHVSSGSLITTDSSKYSILSQTYVGDSYNASLRTLFPGPILTSESTDSDFKIINESPVNTFSLKTKAVQTPIRTATIDYSAINTVLTSNELDSLGYTSHNQQIITNTESPLMPSTFIDHISYSFKMENPSFSSHQYLSESRVTLPIISVNSHLTSAIITTMNHSLYTTNTVIASNLDDTRHSVGDFTDGYQTVSQDYNASASTAFAILFNSTDHHYLSLQTTEYEEIMQTEFTSFVTTPLCESHTDSDATVIYSKEEVTSGISYFHTSVMPSQTQLTSTNDIQDSTTDFGPYFQSNDQIFSSESSYDLLSTSPSRSLLLQFNTNRNDSELGSYMKPTNMSTFEFQSGILTYTHLPSIQISTVLLDFKTTLLTTTINVNSKIMPIKIKYSSKQTNNGISYNELETSFKDSLFPLDSLSGSLISDDTDMTSLSSGVYESISTMSTNIKQSGLSEKNKTIIFISTSSAVIGMIVVILLIIFAKVYKSKFNNIPQKVDDKTSWSNNSIPSKNAFSDYSFSGKNIHPLLNTSSLSLQMFHYEQHWNDLV